MAIPRRSLFISSGYGALACAGVLSLLVHGLVLMLGPRSVAPYLLDAFANPRGALQWRPLVASPEPEAARAAAEPAPPPTTGVPVSVERRTPRARAKPMAAPGPQADPSVPRPLRNPQFGTIRIAGFRIPFHLWVGPDGQVQALAWGASELSAAVLDALGAALRQVAFVPARREGQPVAAQLRLSLCFDDDGQLRASAPECWDPDAAR